MKNIARLEEREREFLRKMQQWNQPWVMLWSVMASDVFLVVTVKRVLSREDELSI